MFIWRSGSEREFLPSPDHYFFAFSNGFGYFYDMRKASLLLFSVFLFTVGARAQTVFYFPHLGDGTFTPLNIKFQTGLVFVNTGDDTNVQVEFFLSDGSAWELTLGDLGTNSVFNIPLLRGQSVSLETPGTANLQSGYAKVTAGPGVGGTAVFIGSDADTGTLRYEAGVPASTPLTDFSLFVDSLGTRDTGLAFVNTGNAPTIATLSLYDTQFQSIGDVAGGEFNLLATTPVPLLPGNNSAQFVHKFLDDVADQAKEMQGSLTVGSEQPLAAVTLRQDIDANTLTTFPVVMGRADEQIQVASFSLLSSGDLVVRFELTPGELSVRGAIYRLYAGKTLIDELVRNIDSFGLVTEVIPMPPTERQTHVDQVEIQLIYQGGHISRAITIPEEQ